MTLRSRRLRFESLESRTLLAADIGLGDWAGTANSEIRAEGEGEVSVRFRLEASDLNGTSQSQVSVGDDFLLNVYVQDVRPNAGGVFAAYVDVGYDVGLLAAHVLPSFGSIYTGQLAGDLSTDGLVDELGAFTSEPPGDGEVFLASARFTAQSAGVVNFASDPADDSPFHDILVFGTVLPVDDAYIDYGTTTIEVLEAPSQLVTLDQQHGFKTDGNFYENWGGTGEKWILDSSDAWFIITVDGELYKWSGTGVAGTLIAQLDSSIHADPYLLVDAEENAANSGGGGNTGGDTAALLISLDEEHEFKTSGDFYENWDGAGEKWLQDADQAWYIIHPNGDLYRWSGSGLTGTFIASLGAEVHADPYLLIDAAENAANNGGGNNGGGNNGGGNSGELVQIDTELGLTATVDEYDNWGGLNEKWMKGNAGVWYFITPDGSLYRWNGGAAGNTTLLYELDSSIYANPELLYNAEEDAAGSGQNGSGADPAAVDAELGLFSQGDVFENWGGLGEKWMEGTGDAWYFILPDGRFYRWHGGAISNNTLLYTFDPSLHANPVLLYNAS